MSSEVCRYLSSIYLSIYLRKQERKKKWKKKEKNIFITMEHFVSRIMGVGCKEEF